MQIHGPQGEGCHYSVRSTEGLPSQEDRTWGQRGDHDVTVGKPDPHHLSQVAEGDTKSDKSR